MNYRKIYDQIIEKARNRVIEGYSENHHIIPKCMGGSDYKDNIVSLTAREHYICHHILHNLYPDNNKLFYAFRTMCKMRNKYQDRDVKINSRMFEYLRIEHSKRLKDGLSPFINMKQDGESNGMFGKKHTEESRKKMSETRKGRKAWNKGIPPSEESNEKRRSKLKGKPRPDRNKDWSLKISRAKSTKVKCLITNTIFESVREYSEYHNITPEGTLYRIKKRTKVIRYE